MGWLGTWCRRILRGFFLVFFSLAIGLVVGKRFRFRISFEFFRCK